MAFYQIFHIFLFSTIFCYIFISNVDAAKYKAFGTIFCNQNEPIIGAKVEFFEDDSKSWAWGNYFDFDDLLDTKFTNGNGTFNVYGEQNEYGSEEPYLWITYQCRDIPLSGCDDHTRLDFEEDFYDENKEYQLNVKIYLNNDTAEVNGKSYKLKKSVSYC